MRNVYDINGKFAIFTGRGKGVGKVAAGLILVSGATVLIWDKNPAAVVGTKPHRIMDQKEA